jgi:WS/DGAT/MGAT family acyltransferase
MHVAMILIFDAGPLLDEDGALCMKPIRRHVERALDSCERYRQRLDRVPGLWQPVWVDDERFDLDFHLRRARVPAPGTDNELKELAARLLSKRLDRDRPLWEMYLIDGLSGDRVAMVLKVHHCMVDGVGGVQLLMSLLRPDPSAHRPKGDERWTPRPKPSDWTMFRDELIHRGRTASRLIDSLNRDRLARGISGLWNALKAGLAGLSTDTCFTSEDLGPERRFEWATFDLQEVKDIRAEHGGTVNDVVLAVVAGAARRYLERRGTNPNELDSLRAVLPVHTGGSVRESAGNQVAMVVAKLPVDEASPRNRMEQVVQETAELKGESHQVEGVKLFEDVADVLTQKLLSSAFKLAFNAEVVDMIVTNVRGPSFPLYLRGARLRSIYPVVPLMPKQDLGIALFSYDGRIHWGFNSDRESFVAVGQFVEDLKTSFDELKRTLVVPGKAHDSGGAHAAAG